MEIRVYCKAEPERCRVFIEDNGRGMSAETLKKLRAEERLTTPGTENEEGSGLGLMLCRDFIAKNGGEFTIESEEGKGSRLSFTIPLSEGHKNQ